MSKGWMAALIVGPLLVIGVAAIFILRAANPPSQSADASTPAAPVIFPSVRVPQNPPTTQPLPKQNDSSAELAQLKAENERLKQSLAAASSQAVQPNKPAMIPAPPPAAKGIVRGSSWLVRNNGASDVQRGLHIYAICKTVPAAGIAGLLRAQADLDNQDALINDQYVVAPAQQEIASDQKRLDDARKEEKAASDDLTRDGDRQWVEAQEQSLKDDERRLNDAKAESANHRKDADKLQKMAQVSRGQDALEAYRFCREFAPLINFSACAKGAATGIEGKTDINGKYEIKDVPSGNYYLYASINTQSLSADWLIPITVDGNVVDADIDNDSAIDLSSN